MRVKGAETRRDLFIPNVFRLGERPAGAVMGARTDDIFARIGVVRRDGSGGGGIALAGASEKVNGLSYTTDLIGPALLFLDGEVGSTFSQSSNVEGSKERLFGDSAAFSEVTLAGLDFEVIAPGINQ